MALQGVQKHFHENIDKVYLLEREGPVIQLKKYMALQGVQKHFQENIDNVYLLEREGPVIQNKK